MSIISSQQAGFRPAIIRGTMIVSCTAVGAGMFSIPILTAGVWFSGALLLLTYTWFCMFISGLMILEVNLVTIQTLRAFTPWSVIFWSSYGVLSNPSRLSLYYIF